MILGMKSSHPLLRRFSFVALLLASGLHIGAVIAAHVEAELIPEVTSIRSGESFWIGLRLHMDADWHTYWKNPGDSGLATQIEWELPPGFEASGIHWPYPQTVRLDPLTTYAYKGEVLLLTEIKVPAEAAAGQALPIKAKVFWLSCEKICIPGEAAFTIQLPVQPATPQADPQWVETFARARHALPIENPDWQIAARADKKDFLLEIQKPAWADYEITSLSFYPDNPTWIDHNAPQFFQKTAGGYALYLSKSSAAPAEIQKLTGVLLAPEGWRGPGSEKALNVHASVTAGSVASPLGSPAPGMLLSTALAFAFLGGLILNLMPCVLPVLSLKVFGFILQASESRLRIFSHGVLYSLGILVTFWGLALALFLLQTAGTEIGWGFQLQSPLFVTALCLLFFLFALNLLGVYETGGLLSWLTQLGRHSQTSYGGMPSFLNGILATLVATPCTAPFMGAALGFGLSQSPFVSFLIFTSLGAGLAFPYLALSAFPGLARMLPKPGPWMQRFKQFLGIILFGTVAWLVWILQIQIAHRGLFFILGLSGLFLILGTWGYGRATLGAEKSFWASRSTAAFLIVLGGITALGGIGILQAIHNPKNQTAAAGLNWEPYTAQRLQTLRTEGKPVMLDFTAAWCLTCQVNERFALGSARVVQAFRDLGITGLKADWTSSDPEITRALASFGRSSVPLYVYYPPGPDSKPELLPEILTPEIVLKIISEK